MNSACISSRNSTPITSTFEFRDLPAGAGWIQIGGKPVMGSAQVRSIYRDGRKPETRSGRGDESREFRQDAGDGGRRQRNEETESAAGQPAKQTAAKPADAHEAEKKKAVAAAEDWLKALDAGKYADCWDSAAKYLKDAVGKDDFAKELKAARGPLGKEVSRNLRLAKFYHTIARRTRWAICRDPIRHDVREQKIGRRNHHADARKRRHVESVRILHQMSGGLWLVARRQIGKRFRAAVGGRLMGPVRGAHHGIGRGGPVPWRPSSSALGPMPGRIKGRFRGVGRSNPTRVKGISLVAGYRLYQARFARVGLSNSATWRNTNAGDGDSPLSNGHIEGLGLHCKVVSLSELRFQWLAGDEIEQRIITREYRVGAILQSRVDRRVNG